MSTFRFIAVRVLGEHHPGTAVIGRVTDQAGEATVRGEHIVVVTEQD